MRSQFERTSLSGSEAWVRIFPDLDHGLEWCEDRLLGMAHVTRPDLPTTLRAQLADVGCDRDQTALLEHYLRRINVGEGEYLIQQGDAADDLYFIEMGKVSVYLELEDGQRLRLSRLGPGTVVGELGLYLSTTRTASVIADWSATVYRLTREALAGMTTKDPALAASFHELVVRLVSERLVAANRSVEALYR